MRPDGWLFLLVSWGAILALAAFCFSRIFRAKR